MSIEALHWALDAPVGGNAKVVLIGVANHAKPDGTGSYPSIDTLAEYAHCDRSTARRNLRKLEAEGWISSTGTGPRGTICWRLVLGRKGREMPPGNLPPQDIRGVATGVASGVAPVPPEPKTENLEEKPPTPPTADSVAEQRRVDLIELFSYWQDRCRKPRARFTDERRKKLTARLDDKYTVLDIRRGIEGAAINPPRDRDNGVVYDDLMSICRNGAQLERYMERADVGGQVVPLRRDGPSDILRRLHAKRDEEASA